MSRTDELNTALSDLQSSSADIEACAVVSEDGLIIASSLPQGLEETRIAAMGTRTATELQRGALQQIFVKGEHGYIIIMNAGPHSVLLAMTRKEAKLGLIFLDLSRTAEKVKNILS